MCRLALVAVIGVVAVSCGDKSATTATPPATSSGIATSAPESTTSITTPTTTSAPTTSAPQTPRPTHFWDVPAGIEVAVAADDGLHLLTGGDDRIIDSTAFDKVVADPMGDGWYVQEGSMTIRHVGDDGSDEVVLGADSATLLQLHDVGMVDGHATVFYNLNLMRNGFGDGEIFDQLYAMNVDSGERRKITDVGGWETSIDVRFGGNKLVGIWTSEVTVDPWSVDLDGQLGPVDVTPLGLETNYTDDPAAPRAMAISADGSRISWVSWNFPDGQLVNQRLVSTNTDGSDRREFILPEDPARAEDLVDRGDYLVAGTWRRGEGGRTPGALIDAETGGMLVLPVEGPAAAWGRWDEPPQWAIPSPVTEDITEEIRALEPQWATGQSDLNYEKALAEVLLGDVGEGECASAARTFSNYSAGDGPFYIELRLFCDDSGAGYWYEVTVVGPMPDGSLTGGATRRALCRRGVTTDGICV